MPSVVVSCCGLRGVGYLDNGHRPSWFHSVPEASTAQVYTTRTCLWSHTCSCNTCIYHAYKRMQVCPQHSMHVYTRMHACARARAHAHAHSLTHAFTHSLSVRSCAWAHACACMCVHACSCANVYTHVCGLVCRGTRLCLKPSAQTMTMPSAQNV